MEAQFIKTIDNGFAGDAALYRISPPIKQTIPLADDTIEESGVEFDHIIGVNFEGTHRAYAADSEGRVVGSGEIGGGQGTYQDALARMGYEEIDEESQ